MITLRKYQEKALKQLKTKGTQVLSICPGGGKTFTALEFTNRNPQFKKILILAHGTTALKTQWANELTKLGLDFSTDIDSKSKFIVAIPHTFTNRTVPQFDLVIVDEAHEFYFAEKMVKTILDKTRHKCLLLLTGTPSKFIRKKIEPIIIISGVEVYSSKDKKGDKYLADTYFGVVTSTYKLKLDQFDEDGAVKKGKIVLTEGETKRSLDALVKEMIVRLKSTKVFGSSPNVIHTLKRVKLNRFQEAFSAFGKTLIAAENIAQARVLHKSLKANGVNAVISESESDVHSKEMEKFKKEKEIQVLLVVRRGILGFDMPTLANVVDFTMSRNIDRIYQLYARVLRTHPDVKHKFFFRMCSALNPAVDSYFLQAAMCLNNPDFISKYDGKNLKQLDIIVKKKINKRVLDGKRDKKGESIDGRKIFIDPIMADEILSLELMSDMAINSNSKYWKEFGYMKFGEVMEKLTGKVFNREVINMTVKIMNRILETGIIDGMIYEQNQK